MIRVAVTGAAGRMGRLVTGEVAADPELTLVAALECEGTPQIGQDAGVVAGRAALGVPIGARLDEALGLAQVVIDFSAPAATVTLAEACARARVALVTGTTGLDADQKQRLAEQARAVPIVAAPNMSTGVTVLLRLVEEAVRLLGEGYDAEIVEMHHRHKKDAPSGTALALAESVARARDQVLARVIRGGREGQVGARPAEEIGVHAVRGGDVVGDHTVILAADGERVEVGHRASSRLCFARGAVRAARWLVGEPRPPGLYSMRDVLGLG